MNWLLLTLLSAMLGSLTRILQKVHLKDEQSDPFAFGFVFQLSVALLFFLYTVVTKSFELPSLSGLFGNIVVMALFYSLANLCVFKAFKYTEASEVSIILASGTIWSVLAALVLLREKLTVINVLGILLIVAGVGAISYTHSKWRLNNGHAFALAGAVLFGFAFTNDIYIISRYQSIASYMVIAFALPGLISLAFSPKSVKHLPHFLQAKVLRNLVLSSSIYALSAVAIFTAYKLGGKASIISPISETSIIFTVGLGYFLLHERDNMPNKIIGTVFAFIGVLLLSGFNN